MIAVVGSLLAVAVESGHRAAGRAVAVARAANAAGARVEIVGRIGEDAAGDEVLLDIAAAGLGHVAVLRDAGHATEETRTPLENDAPPFEDAHDSERQPLATAPSAGSQLDAADIELALRYLPEYAVIVVAERIGPAGMRVVSDAASWSGAALVVVGSQEDLDGIPDDATAFAPPDDGDPDGAFAAMVGTYAAGLDRGDDPREAFAAASAAVGSSVAE